MKRLLQRAYQADWLFLVGLVAAVFLAYQPVWHAQFIWDDDDHLLRNPVLGPGGLALVWTPGGYRNFWPLTYTAYWVQHALWRLDPTGYHLVNIALHAVSALLVWRVCVALQIPGAKLAAAMFALHPVNVESVAWVSQLKNDLSLPLALAALVLYWQYVERGGRWRFAAALGAFLLSTLAKGMVLTLPLVLLAVTWWRRGRIQRRDWLQVLPFAVVSLVMSGIEVAMQHHVSAAAVRSDGFLSRVVVAGCAVWFYLEKLILPVNLSFIYPRWQMSAADVWAWLPGLLLVAAMALTWWQRERWGRAALAALVAYIALLLPALGFVNIYFMAYSLVADHWQYAAMIVPCAVFAALLSRLPWPAALRGTVAAALLLTLATLTWRQAHIYRNNTVLYEATLRLNPECVLARNNLGAILLAEGKTQEAAQQFEAVLGIDPHDATAHFNLGVALASLGRTSAAMEQYEAALKINPQDAEAHNKLGGMRLAQGQLDLALQHYEATVRLNPNDAMAHNNRGYVLDCQGQLEAAIPEYEAALKLEPDYLLARYNLGNVLLKLGRPQAAAPQFMAALKIEPNNPEGQRTLGEVLLALGQPAAAATHFEAVVKLTPENEAARNRLGQVLVELKRYTEAEPYVREAVARQPDDVAARARLATVLLQQGKTEAALHQLELASVLAPDDPKLLYLAAWIRATAPDAKFRNGREAVRLAEQMCRASSRTVPHYLDGLAAAYAEAGRFPEAVSTAQQAAVLAIELGDNNLASQIQQRLALYQEQKPFHEPPPPGL